MKIDGIPPHKCLVCHADFNMTDEAPVCLPCGHVFGKNCLMAMRQLRYSKCLRCKVDWSQSQINELPVIACLVRQMSTDSGVGDRGAPCEPQEEDVNQESEVSKTDDEGQESSDRKVEDNADTSDRGTNKSNEREIAVTNIRETERSGNSGKKDKKGNNRNKGDIRKYCSAGGTERGCINAELRSNSTENTKWISDDVVEVERILSSTRKMDGGGINFEVKESDSNHAKETDCKLTQKADKNCRVTDETEGRSCDTDKTENKFDNISKIGREPINTKTSESDNNKIQKAASTSQNSGNGSRNGERSDGAGRGNEGKYKRKRNRGSKKKKNNIKEQETSVKEKENLVEDISKEEMTQDVSVCNFQDGKIDLNQTCEKLELRGENTEEKNHTDVYEVDVKFFSIEEEDNKNHCSNLIVQNTEPLIQKLNAVALECKSERDLKLHNPDTHLKNSCSNFLLEKSFLTINCTEVEHNQVDIQKTEESGKMSPAEELTNQFLPSDLDANGNKGSLTDITMRTDIVKDGENDSAIMTEVFVNQNSAHEDTEAAEVCMNSSGVQEEIKRTKPDVVQTEANGIVNTSSGVVEECRNEVLDDKQNVDIINALQALFHEDDEVTTVETTSLEESYGDHFELDSSPFLQDNVNHPIQAVFENGIENCGNTSYIELQQIDCDYFKYDCCKIRKRLDDKLGKKGNLDEKICGSGTPIVIARNDDDNSNIEGACFGTEERDVGSVEPLLRDLLESFDAIDKQLSSCVSNVPVNEENGDIETIMSESVKRLDEISVQSNVGPLEPVRNYNMTTGSSVLESNEDKESRKITHEAALPNYENVDILGSGGSSIATKVKDDIQKEKMLEDEMGRDKIIINNEQVFDASETEKNCGSGISFVSSVNEFEDKKEIKDLRKRDGSMNRVMLFGTTENEHPGDSDRHPGDSDQGGKDEDNNASLSYVNEIVNFLKRYVEKETGQLVPMAVAEGKGNIKQEAPLLEKEEEEVNMGAPLLGEEEEVNMGAPLLGEEEEEINMGAPLFGEEEEEINIDAPLLGAEDEEVNMGAPLLEEEEEVNMGAPLLGEEEEEINMGAPLFGEEDEEINIDAPLLGAEDEEVNMCAPLLEEIEKKTKLSARLVGEEVEDIPMGAALLEEEEDDIIMGAPLLGEEDEDINLGALLLEEGEEEINMGAPLFDETDDNINMGTSLFHESDDDISMGAPLFDEHEETIKMGASMNEENVNKNSLFFDGDEKNANLDSQFFADVAHNNVNGEPIFKKDEGFGKNAPDLNYARGATGDIEEPSFEQLEEEFLDDLHRQRIEQVIEDECRVSTESDETPSSTPAETSHDDDYDSDIDDVNVMFGATEGNDSSTVAAKADKANSSNNRSEERRKAQRKPNVLEVDINGVISHPKESVKRRRVPRMTRGLEAEREEESVKRQRGVRKTRVFQARREEDKDLEDTNESQRAPPPQGRSILLYLTALVVLLCFVLLWILSQYGLLSSSTPSRASH